MKISLASICTFKRLNTASLNLAQITKSCLYLALPLHTIISLIGVLQHLIRGSKASAERNSR